MKKLISMFLAMSMVFSLATTPVFASDNAEDMRAVWISSIYNIDFPSVENKGNSTAQKAEFSDKLDKYKAAGINTVIVQVRPKGDALYSSSLNPWSEVLTGTQGKNPGYDPLEYMVQEVHKRGMEIHAWLNPYRISTSGTDVSALADGNIAKQHPDWLLEYNNALTLDPANEGVKQFICDTVAEVVDNYDVDGIHFDDYFYPSGYPLQDGETIDGSEANQRRADVNDLIKRVHSTVKSCNSEVVFGVSPMGIYKDVTTNGYTIKGGESYYGVFADTLAWINNGWVDYIVPQVYWETTHATAAYENVVDWWNRQMNGTNVKLYIGEAIYKDAVAAEIGTHLSICDKYPNVKGNFYFSSTNLLVNRKGCLDTLTKIYNSSTSVTATSVGESGNSTDENSEAVTNPVGSTKILEAVSTKSTVLVDGIETEFEAYNIEGYNFFKLRDIAYAISETDKQFDTVWNEDAKAINMVTRTPYTAVGGELISSSVAKTKTKTAIKSEVLLQVNGVRTYCDVYNIDGYSYFKLRDVAQAIDFGVVWSEELNTIGIVTLVGNIGNN
ncbi:MAG: glycoside hydrolase family 10 protein [Anaerotignaceae bacterium]